MSRVAGALERAERLQKVKSRDGGPDSQWLTPSQRGYSAASTRVGVLDNDLFRYVDIVRRRWRLGLLVFAVVVLGVSAGVLLKAPVYRATGLLEIRRESAGTVSVETLFGSERIANDELETQFGILKSTTLAGRVVTELSREGTGAGAPGPSIERFQEVLLVNPKRGSRLVEVSYDADSPETAARVVNAVFDNFLQLRMEEAQKSADWLMTQLQDAQRKLETSENQLRTYVRQQGLEVLETGKGEMAQEVNDRLRTLNASLVRAHAERIDKQSVYELAADPASSNPRNAVAETLSVRLTDLRREYARLLSTFYEDYPAVKAVKGQVVELESALATESQLAADRLEQEYRTAVRREALLRESLTQQNALAQALGGNSSGYESLRRDVVTNQQLFALLNQRLKEVSISAALKASNVGIVDRPRPPTAPHGSYVGFNIGLAVIAGLFMGMGAVLLKEHLDTSVRTVDDVEGYLGVPALAAIPSVVVAARLLPAGTTIGPRGPWRRIDQDAYRQSPLGDAFAALRTAVVLNDDGPPPRVLLVTSARSAEGKTTVSINLALSLARLSYRVLLIDANMRYPCVQQALDLEKGPGLVGYLASDVDWPACGRMEANPGLDVIVCGEWSESPADLLSLPRMRQLVSEASGEYDYVVMDSPALLAHPADVRALAALADSVLLVVRQGTTPREAVSVALSQLTRVRGVILNQSDASDMAAHYRDVTTVSRV